MASFRSGAATILDFGSLLSKTKESEPQRGIAATNQRRKSFDHELHEWTPSGSFPQKRESISGQRTTVFVNY
jgi:hypothetical protein